MPEYDSNQIDDDEKVSESICAEPRCYYRPMRGYIYCVGHLYEFPDKAPEEAISWKKHKENTPTNRKVIR